MKQKQTICILSGVVLIVFAFLAGQDAQKSEPGSHRKFSDRSTVTLVNSGPDFAATKSEKYLRLKLSNDWKQSKILSQLSMLNIGMSLEEVEALLGSPISYEYGINGALNASKASNLHITYSNDMVSATLDEKGRVDSFWFDPKLESNLEQWESFYAEFPDFIDLSERASSRGKALAEYRRCNPSGPRYAASNFRGVAVE
ncbi:MAG: hypothetical protein ACSHX6_13275 [Akkermansiaceae bacterium]